MIIPLLRLAVPTTYDYHFLAYGGGVYFARLTKPPEGYGPFYSKWDDTGVNITRIIVQQVRVSLGVLQFEYSEKSTLNDCIGDDESWYFDKAEQTLYVHYLHGYRPGIVKTVIGVLRGYSYKTPIYIDDIFYDARIIGIPEITLDIDPLNLESVAFQDQAVTLENGDGELDVFLSNPIPGALGQYVLHDDSDGSELEHYSGYVSMDDTPDDRTLQMKLIDPRSFDTVKIPNVFFNATDYPDIADRWVDEVIPDGYGWFYGMRGVPLNEAATGTPDIVFKYAQAGYNLISTLVFAVHRKVDDEWLEISSGDLTWDHDNAEVTVTRALVMGTSRDQAYEVRVDACLRIDIQPGATFFAAFLIIKDLNERHLGVSYDSSEYNITEFEDEGNLVSSIYMDEQKPLIEWIGIMQNTSQDPFIYFRQGDGRRTIRNATKSRTPTSISRIDLSAPDQIGVKRDFLAYASSVVVKYAKDRKYGTYKRYENNDYEAATVREYKKIQQDIIESPVAVGTIVDDLADFLALDRSQPRKETSFTRKVERLSDIDADFYDQFNVDTSIEDETEPVYAFLESPGGDVYSESPGREYNVLFEEDPTGDDYEEVPDGDVFYDDPGWLPPIFYDVPGLTRVITKGREYHGTVNGKVTGTTLRLDTMEYEVRTREVPA